MPKKDSNQIAFHIVALATGQIETPKKSESLAKGRAGGLKGGKARADKLTSEQRKEIASKAAKKRWKK